MHTLLTLMPLIIRNRDMMITPRHTNVDAAGFVYHLYRTFSPSRTFTFPSSLI
jgi:hypothetical protein